MPALCIFEDGKAANFHPLTLTRPVFELVCGMTSLRRKIARAFPGVKVVLSCRKELTASVSRRTKDCKVNDFKGLDDDTLLVNGRALVKSSFPLEPGEALVRGDDVVAARLPRKAATRFLVGAKRSAGEVLALARTTQTTEMPLLEYHWDLIARLNEAIIADYQAEVSPTAGRRLPAGSHLYGGTASDLFIAKDATVFPGVIFDVSEGPIYVGSGATIKPPSYIQGPTCIGMKSLVDGAKLREGCCIGPVCKIGGEVEAAVFHAYSNKHHEGFIGHAYLGEWVNCGALCTNSDLKNNYKAVRVQLSADRDAQDTGQRFVGSCIGDHTKLGIGTLLNTGAVVGMGCNVFGGGVSPKYIASFTWGGNAGFVEHRLDKMLETATIVMKRRKIDLDEIERAVLTQSHEATASDREQFLNSKSWLKSVE